MCYLLFYDIFRDGAHKKACGEGNGVNSEAQAHPAFAKGVCYDGGAVCKEQRTAYTLNHAIDDQIPALEVG